MSSTRLFFCYTMQPLEYNVCGQLISPSGFLHHRRTFNYNVLILIREGTLHITANSIPYSLSKGQYILLKANEEHYGHQPSDGKLSYLWLHFTADFKVISDKSLLYSYLLPEYATVTNIERTMLLFQQLLKLSLEEKLYSHNMLDYYISMIFMELSQDYFQCISKPSDNLPTIIPIVIEWIKNNYQRPFTVSTLAKEMGYQADYLSSLFKRSVGISIVKYTNQLRIKTAKNILLNYDITIKEAAYSCGFVDEKYFMKIFKQLEGMTPSAFKKISNNN